MIDQIDAVNRALGFERPVDNHFLRLGRNPHGNFQLVPPDGYIRDGKEPDHAGVLSREVAHSDAGKYSEEVVFARGRVDMHAVTNDPG